LSRLRSREHEVLTQLLVELRESKFRTQKDFIAKTGMRRSTVERIESGSMIPSFIEALDWARACDVTELSLAYRYKARLKRSRP
jgi:transcriptional regulator with XRE-family HTH domain